MSSRLRLFDSSVGSKILIGLTGLFLVLYLIIHIVGNLMVFGGPDFFNHYAHFLESNPLLPIIEILLLLVFLLHIYKTIRMYLGNQAARPAKYMKKQSAGYTSRKTFASTTMIVSGLWLVLFLLIHVRAFRFGPGLHEYKTAEGIVDLYRVEMENLHNPLMVAFYVISMLVVGSHVYHGASSAWQSIGVDHPRWTPRILLIGKILAVAIGGGFIIIALWAHLVGGQVHS
jgi:succinate dehydrogenase / fumarate reductase, cytochrome b subunit